MSWSLVTIRLLEVIVLYRCAWLAVQWRYGELGVPCLTSTSLLSVEATVAAAASTMIASALDFSHLGVDLLSRVGLCSWWMVMESAMEKSLGAR